MSLSLCLCISVTITSFFPSLIFLPPVNFHKRRVCRSVFPPAASLTRLGSLLLLWDPPRFPSAIFTLLTTIAVRACAPSKERGCYAKATGKLLSTYSAPVSRYPRPMRKSPENLRLGSCRIWSSRPVWDTEQNPSSAQIQESKTIQTNKQPPFRPSGFLLNFCKTPPAFQESKHSALPVVMCSLLQHEVTSLVEAFYMVCHAQGCDHSLRTLVKQI